MDSSANGHGCSHKHDSYAPAVEIARVVEESRYEWSI
jgi:hypothetical protein